MSIEKQIKRVEEFRKQFGEAINAALQDGVTIGTVIQIMDDTSFDLRIARKALQEAHAAQQVANKIIPANGQVPPFPSRS